MCTLSFQAYFVFSISIERSAIFLIELEVLSNSVNSLFAVSDIIKTFLLSLIMEFENQSCDWVSLIDVLNVLSFDHNFLFFICQCMKFNVSTLELCAYRDVLFGFVDDLG